MSDGENDGQAVLETAYEALKEEYERIQSLLASEAKNPLSQYARVISAGFTQTISQVNSYLTEIDSKLKKLKASQLNDESREGILKECWDDYFALRSILMPTLSTELLALIGGVYVRDKRLDDTRLHGKDLLDDAANPISFSEMAEVLVKDLALRSGKGWESVLIVGEERLTFSEAEIIRLRFPACDIWNLPFTAHEYGYLVARKDNKVPEKFRDLRDRVRSDVNPKNHQAVGSPPQDNRQCFLPEVLEIWDHYHDELRTDDARTEFLTKNEQRLTALTDEQESHLCRLFADCFATFFVGPAYVLALLHLRFLPDSVRQPSVAGMPNFAQRFVFALETLKWMDAEPLIDVAENRSVFINEVDEQNGIPALWRATLRSMNMADPYQSIVEQYQDWINKIKYALRFHFSAQNAIGTTYKNWRAVKAFQDQLRAVDQKVSERPEMWSVLNGAWVERWKHRDDALQIHDAALRLLKDPTVIKPAEKTAPGGAAAKQKESVDRDAIALVKKALAKDPPARRLFVQMEENSRFQQNTTILTALDDDDEAYDTYVKLYEKSSGMSSDGGT